MDLPQLINATEIVTDAESLRAQLPDKRWVPIRGIRPTWICLRRRIKLAWMVFTGKADAVIWDA